MVKVEIKVSLFTNDIILYLEDLKHSTEKLLELIMFSNVAEYKMNTKINSFLYISNELTEKLRKYHSQLHQKKLKYIEINITKEVKDLYENYIILKKEIKEDIRKWKHSPCSWTSRTNVVKIAILPKLVHTFTTTPIKITAFRTGLGKKIQKFLRNKKRPRMTKVILGYISKA